MFNLNEIKQPSLGQSYQLATLLYLARKVSNLSVEGEAATAIVVRQKHYHVRLKRNKSTPDESMDAVVATVVAHCSCPL